MMTLRKRGRGFYADLLNGEARVRGSLGTRNQDAARRLVHKLETALSEGSASPLWVELRASLPRATFVRFADLAGVKEQQVPTWNHLHESFKTHMAQRVKIGKLQSSTEGRYKMTLREFESFLGEQRITLLKDITKPVVEAFKVWRVERIKKKKFARGGTGLVLDAAILHHVFAFALENEMIVKNPVRMEGRPGENPNHGAEPFNGSDLSRLREHAADDLLTFLLLRWTGLRGSDAVSLTWREVHFDSKEIERLTQKRRKKVVIPIQTELLFALEAEHERKKPEPSDRVLLNPLTGKPLTRPRLYQRMLALGKRASVPDAHPHRFRDTLAVDMLTRGASPCDVAKVLGDTIETVEKHYTPFVKELRERVRSILENDAVGLESTYRSDTVTPASQSAKRIQ
ncbi:MAG TPA: site-specific integrase [Terriglobales bacterium]|nr:site-specific integrase [Terriglobales bacterium]